MDQLRIKKIMNFLAVRQIFYSKRWNLHINTIRVYEFFRINLFQDSRAKVRALKGLNSKYGTALAFDFYNGEF